jgi:hypothetical protein
MVYSQFTIGKIKSELGYQIVENFGIFSQLPIATISPFLTELLGKFLRLRDRTVEVDMNDYFLNDVGKLLGILNYCVS